MPKWPRLTGKELVRFLEKEGYKLIRIRGSHYRFIHTSGNKVTVPIHANRSVPIGTLQFTVSKMLGLSCEVFLEHLRMHKIRR